MTTNQTIDGVPRELLERIREKLSQTGYTWSVNDPEEELRALLDAPVPPSKFVGAAQYWSENEQVLRDVCRFEGLKGLVYQVVRDCAKPAAQPAPVAVVPEGFMLVERSIWTEEQVESAAKCVTMLKCVPGMTDRDLALAAMDAGQCKAPEVTLADFADLDEVTRLNTK